MSMGDVPEMLVADQRILVSRGLVAKGQSLLYIYIYIYIGRQRYIYIYTEREREID